MKIINSVQLHVFQLMKAASFNNFDGDLVADNLMSWRERWDGVIFTDDNQGNGLTLRDIEHNYWHADTMYIKTTSVYADALLADIALNWNASDAEIISSPKEFLMEFEGDLAVIRVWWD